MCAKYLCDFVIVVSPPLFTSFADLHGAEDKHCASGMSFEIPATPSYKFGGRALHPKESNETITSRPAE